MLGADARYAQVMPADGKLASAALPGFWLHVADPFKAPLPDPLSLLQEMGV